MFPIASSNWNVDQEIVMQFIPGIFQSIGELKLFVENVSVMS